MAQFVLLLRDNGSWPGDMSPEEMQKILGRYREWIGSMKGKGEKLRDREGRVVSPTSSKVGVTDGPYVETKEVVGGFLLIEAKDYDDAVRMCETSPHLTFGSIEIRQIQATGRD
jgi:hypothetical protein